ncbi:hypothetical protein Tco_0528649 [Tanacetum coccineum]
MHDGEKRCDYIALLKAKLKQKGGKFLKPLFVILFESIKGFDCLSGSGDGGKVGECVDDYGVMVGGGGEGIGVVVGIPRIGRRTGRGGGGTREPRGRVGGRTRDQDGQGVIAQQLEDLLHTIIAQVGNHTSNIQGDVRSVNVNNGRNGCSYKEFMACGPKDYNGKGGTISYTHWMEKMESVQDMSGCRANQKVKYTAGSFISGHAAYTDRFHELARLVPHLVTPKNKRIERIGSLRKNAEKRGNGEEPSRDGNVRDEHKRSRAGREFASTTNPVRREYMGVMPK